MQLMIISQADLQVGSGSGEMQGRIALFVQKPSTPLQSSVVFAPVSHWIWNIDTSSRKDCVPETCHGHLRRFTRKRKLGPSWSGTRHNCPVNLVPCNQVESRTSGLRQREVGARDLRSILTGQKRRVRSANR